MGDFVYRRKLVANSWVCVWVVLGQTISDVKPVVFHHLWTDYKRQILLVDNVLKLKKKYQFD